MCHVQVSAEAFDEELNTSARGSADMEVRAHPQDTVSVSYSQYSLGSFVFASE
jgi:hypothetical protein